MANKKLKYKNIDDKFAKKMIIWGYLFVVIDLTLISQMDTLNDAFGYLLIFVSLLLLGNRDKLLIIECILLICISFFANTITYLGEPTWKNVFIRCLPPIVSLFATLRVLKFFIPSRVILNKYYFIYFVAQIFDLLCIIYFVPVKSTVLVNSFNSMNLLTFVPCLIYTVMMSLFLNVFVGKEKTH